ncbi:MAG: purine-binding chemotaxis protein CheW [Nitrospirae bacterium]|nr:purine-binding chemotaxis protein CheW [Nitrospirota bacterium]
MDIAKIRKKIKQQGGSDKNQTLEKKPDSAENASEETKVTEGQTEVEETHGLAEPPGGIEEMVEVLAFRLSGEEYAIRIGDIQEILRNQRITIVPRAPSYLQGVTSIRGKIVPIIDLNSRLGLKKVNSERRKIIILFGTKGPIGILVDKVTGVLKVSKNELHPPPATLTESEANFIEGVARIQDKFISLLKLEEVTKIGVMDVYSQT